MLLFHFIDSEHIHAILRALAAVSSHAYYVQMAVAWAVAECYVKQPQATLPYLERYALDDFTHNKAIQKITESRRVSAEDKAMLRAMKRKPARPRT